MALATAWHGTRRSHKGRKIEEERESTVESLRNLIGTEEEKAGWKRETPGVRKARSPGFQWRKSWVRQKKIGTGASKLEGKST